MKENNQDRRNRGRRRFRHDQETPRITIPSMTCVVCSQPIADMPNAMAFGPSQGPTHFDCVLQELSKTEPLQEGEKITYLGSGTFGVIVEKDEIHFEIHKKIQVEDLQNLPEWRKEIRNMFKK